MSSSAPTNEPRFEPRLNGFRIALVGRLSSMSRRDAQQLIREHGGTPVDKPDGSTHLAVVGDDQLPLLSDLMVGRADDLLDEAALLAVQRGELKVIGETELWHRLGLVDSEVHIQRLYTPAMLADLLGIKVEIIRRWHRRGLIKPVREVRRLPYFDFQEVSTARRLAELLAEGISPGDLEKRLAQWADTLPDVQRPLSQLAVIVRGRHLLLKQGEGLIAPNGQRWFEFSDELPGNTNSFGPLDELSERQTILPLGDSPAKEAMTHQAPPEVLVDMAERMEDEGDLHAAADLYRTALAAGGPDASISFALAELLYRLGDVAAARERYFGAIELDEGYVEARANLGCLLAETGQAELAVAAFFGALKYHPDYADVHFHLARSLDELGRRKEALHHWRTFLRLAPDSPWGDEVRDILEGNGSQREES
ncbi:MAG: tetratricopeptide repeat protein [Planctomycetota bacterium]|nr:tetratricopeptide repeat protein [Planctomycetota bacterium]